MLSRGRRRTEFRPRHVDQRRGLLIGLPVNMLATGIAAFHGMIYQPYVGTAVFTGGADFEGNTLLLTDEQVELLLRCPAGELPTARLYAAQEVGGLRQRRIGPSCRSWTSWHGDPEERPWLGVRRRAAAAARLRY